MSSQSKTVSTAIKQILLASTVSTAMVASQSVMADSFTEALTGGKASVNLNVRYESVDQDGVDDASALTERIRVGYETGSYEGFKAFVEFSGSESLGKREDYRVPAGSDANAGSSKAVIADPVVNRLNQANIAYAFGKSVAKVGKQRIVWDHRYLGNVGWRQTEQVYTAAALHFNEIENLKASLAYISEVDNIFGVKTPVHAYAIKLDTDIIEGVNLTGYGYFIDTRKSASDSQTIGVRATGKASISDSMGFNYLLETAKQSDYADSDGVDADYTHIKAGMSVSGINFAIAQETLGGDGTYSFQTPLATKHAYNGWADKFLSTPAAGLVDTYAQIGTKLDGYKLAATFHQFEADKGGAKYGDELDIVLAKKFTKNYSAGVKLANYKADDHATDTNKVWLWGTVKF